MEANLGICDLCGRDNVEIVHSVNPFSSCAECWAEPIPEPSDKPTKALRRLMEAAPVQTHSHRCHEGHYPTCSYCSVCERTKTSLRRDLESAQSKLDYYFNTSMKTESYKRELFEENKELTAEVDRLKGLVDHLLKLHDHDECIKRDQAMAEEVVSLRALACELAGVLDRAVRDYNRAEWVICRADILRRARAAINVR